MRPVCWLVGGLVLVIGCTQSRESTPGAEGANGVFQRALPHQVSTREYRVDPPDEITVKAPGIKEIDGQKQKVRPDGKITLNLVGEVYVAGLTPTEINALLKKLVEKYYTTDPDVKVEVIANSKFYIVGGFGVARQGKYAYTGRDTIITALAEAGFNEGAWPQQVLLSRPGKDGKANETAVVDFSKIWGYGDMKQNYLIEEGDVIEVKQSPLKYFQFKMEQVVGPITGSAGAVSAGTSVASPTGTGVR
jgi:polysaccharide export outer membrane protein